MVEVVGLKNLKQRILPPKDQFETRLKVTDGLELKVISPGQHEHLIFKKKTIIKENGAELTLDAYVALQEEIYYVGDYLRFVWHNPYEIYGPPDYVKNEVVGKINAFYFNAVENGILFHLDAYYREYGSQTPFTTSKESFYNPKSIKHPEKLSEDEYTKFLKKS